jgi:diguanylate cyclase (GGDEF)-like protein
MPHHNPHNNNRFMTDRTLAEQLNITEIEIESRKSMLGISVDDIKILKSAKPLILDKIDEIVSEFYDKQVDIVDIQLLIGDAETFSRLHASMKKYVVELFEGYYDKEYVNKRLRIGKVHKRIGVSPKLYIASIHMLESTLQRYLLPLRANGDHGLGNGQGNGHGGCATIDLALRKILAFDTELVFDTYIHSLVAEVRSTRDQLARYTEWLEETVAERTRQLEELSRRDTLTGLFNQRHFYEQLRRELAVAERNRQPLSLVYMDLDNFKTLNDLQGHKAGDEMLEMVAQSLTATVRDIDIACRYGGDEFCIIMPNTTLPQAVSACRRLIDDFDGRRWCDVYLSIGIAQLGPGEFCDSDTFVKSADKRMYEAKFRSREHPGHTIAPAPGEDGADDAPTGRQNETDVFDTAGDEQAAL